jgi:hypothetical protein
MVLRFEASLVAGPVDGRDPHAIALAQIGRRSPSSGDRHRDDLAGDSGSCPTCAGVSISQPWVLAVIATRAFSRSADWLG